MPLLRCLLTTLLACAMAVASANAGVRGAASWNWVDFQRDGGAGRDLDASSFLQQYSVLYDTQGVINSGRAGEWSLALGYEWSSLDNSVGDVDNQVDAGKVLYTGDLVFAPGGLPFRLHMFSYDMNRSAELRTSNELLVTPRVVTDLYDSGQNVVTGFTLLAGIKNGSYLGQYREVLSKVPRLLIDYRQEYVRDLDGLNPQHYRMRDLAFVSLNKKSNWFHYRVREYTDFEDQGNDFEERTYMLGTVDHTMTREWINLTNWISVSVDGSLNQVQTTNRDGSSSQQDSYLLNMFSRATRKAWNLSNFTSMERTLKMDGGLEKDLVIPTFASGQIDPLTKWRFQLIQSNEEDEPFPDVQRTEHLFYTAYQLERQLASQQIFTTDAYLDAKRSTYENDGQAARLQFQLASDVRRELPTTYLASVAFSYFSANDTKDDFFEQIVTLAADSQLSAQLRAGGRQFLAWGTGNYQSEITEYLKPASSGSIGNTYYADNELNGSTYRSTTEIYLEYLPGGRWKHRLSAYYDFIERSSVKEDKFRIEAESDYSTRDFYVHMENSFSSGDDIEVDSLGDELYSTQTLVGVPENSFYHQTKVTYKPYQAWSSGGSATVVWANGSLGNVGGFRLEQNADYTLIASNGMRKPLLTLEQEAIYQQIVEGAEDKPWYAELNLAATWYPFSFLTVNAFSQFRHLGPSGLTAAEYSIGATIPFEKLQVHVAYSYGQLDDDNWQDDEQVKEQQWEIDIKKTF